MAGVEDGEADVGDGESREVIVAERQIFRCPATQNDPLVPGMVLRWRYSANGLSNQSHNIISVVVKLQRGQLEKRFSPKWLTLMSSNTQISSRPGLAKYSSKSASRGIDC